MKTSRISIPSFVLAAFALAASPALAVVTPIDLYRLGEADAGAVPSFIGNATTIDSIGASNLSRTGSPTYSASAHAAGSTLSMDFSGAGSHYSAAPISAVTNNFGIEAWVRPQGTAGNRAIAYNGNSGTAGWGLYQIGGNFQGLFGGVAFVGSAPVTVDRWTHVALVRDSGTSTLYVNGVASGTSGANPNPVAGSFMVGGNPLGAAETFNGAIDNVRAFTFTPGAFSVADLSLATNPFTVVSHYRLGDHDPGAAAGNTGNSVTIDDGGLRDLTRGGSPVYTSNTPGNLSSLAMDFSATGQNYAASPILTNAQNNWIIEAWARAESTSGNATIAYNGNTGTSGFGLYRIGSEWQGLFGGVALLDVNATVQVGKWTHLALVREAGLTRLLVDGVQVGGTFGNVPNVPAGNFMIGGNPLNSPETFDGQIDEVRLSLLNGPFNTSMLLLNINAIPEPGSASLALLSLTALCARRRRAA